MCRLMYLVAKLLLWTPNCRLVQLVSCIIVNWKEKEICPQLLFLKTSSKCGCIHYIMLYLCLHFIIQSTDMWPEGTEPLSH